MPPFRKFHSIAALCGDGLRPELQALFERLAVDPHSELFARGDGKVQSGPDCCASAARAKRRRDPRLKCGRHPAFCPAQIPIGKLRLSRVFACLKAVGEVDFDADYAMLNKIFATDLRWDPAAIARPSALKRLSS
jgi:hypothetical protein